MKVRFTSHSGQENKLSGRESGDDVETMEALVKQLSNKTGADLVAVDVGGDWIVQ